jgi:hypothetical protein
MRNHLLALVLAPAFALSFAACSNGDPTGGDGNVGGNGSGTDPFGNGSGSGSGQSPFGGNDGGSTPSNDSGVQPAPGDSGSGTKDGGNPAVDSGSPAVDSGTPNDGFDQFQHHNLDVVNKYRATLSVPPLVLDKQLCAFALAGSQELSQDHIPHQHFINASNLGTIWQSGFTSAAAENQGDPNGWYVMASDPTTNELDQIDSIQLAMFNEGPGTGEAHGHYTNMMNAQYRRLGVGLLEVNGQLYLTNDFSD